MKLYSTNNYENKVSLKEAIFKSLPEDKGLFMPEEIPQLSKDFIKTLSSYSFTEIAFEITKTLFQGTIPENDLKVLLNKAISFPAPIVSLTDHLHVLELFHGPSLAFKDFGARFMSQLMSYFNKEEDKRLVILVATSGDTGGAVAAGFHKTPGIEVVILYPKGKVSLLQEKQLTTLGHNISALEIDGTFDDCQALVKQAFLDKDLSKKLRLSSANSINIARLIPQSFYYFEAFKQLNDPNASVVFSIPSGNFGNLTAGLLAKKMGLPVHKFIAATNNNDVVPSYLNSGVFQPKPSVSTISNAMDVGNPSNFVRMVDLYLKEGITENKASHTCDTLKKDIVGYTFNDHVTRKAIKDVYERYNYIIEPHGAIGYLALQSYLKNNPEHHGIILETAHPSKFISEVENILERKINIPERLACLADKEKKSTLMDISFQPFKTWLLNNY